MVSNYLPGCRTLESAKSLCKDVKGAKPVSVDVEDSEALDAEVGKVDGEPYSMIRSGKRCAEIMCQLPSA